MGFQVSLFEGCFDTRCNLLHNGRLSASIPIEEILSIIINTATLGGLAVELGERIPQGQVHA